MLDANDWTEAVESADFSWHLFDILSRQDDKVIVATEDSFTCQAALLAWACETQGPFQFHFAIRERRVYDMAQDEDTNGEGEVFLQAIQSNAAGFKGRHEGRHWLELQSDSIVKAWKAYTTGEDFEDRISTGVIV